MATTYDRSVELHSSATRHEPDAGLRAVFLMALRYTLITTLLVGIVYPLTITAFARLTMPAKADGQLIIRDGQVIGSAIIGQNFASPRYFHPRPSAAGTGYDAANSGGSNLASSNRALITRIENDIAAWHSGDPKPTSAVPIDLVTTSASGLDPDISPAAAYFQVQMVAAARHVPETVVRAVVSRHIEERQLGFLGEPRVNVLELNLALDQLDAYRVTEQQ